MKPSAAKALLLLGLVTVKVGLAIPVFRVITPLLIEEPLAPLSVSIWLSRVAMESVMLIWFGGVAPEATKVIVLAAPVPLTWIVLPTTKGVERTSAPPGVAVPPSCVALVIAGVDSTLPPRVTLLTPSNPAAVPPIVTSAVVLVVIWMLPLAFIVTLEAGTPAPDAIALRTSDISAPVGDFRPIVVTAGGPQPSKRPRRCCRS